MFKKNFNILKSNAHWLSISIFIFLTGFAITFVFCNKVTTGLLADLNEEQLQALYNLGKTIFNHNAVAGIILLFFNNLLALVYMLMFGVILGIVPLLGLFANGSLLGVVSASLVQKQVNLIALLALGILPHGIFELPAFIIGAAFGLKLGFHILFPLPHKKRGESFKFIWSEIFTLLPLIVFLLFLGATIEILISPSLLSLII